MSVGPTPIICDECQAVKGEGNKWLIGALFEDGTLMIGIRFGPREKRQDWCSEKCLYNAVSKAVEASRKARASE